MVVSLRWDWQHCTPAPSPSFPSPPLPSPPLPHLQIVALWNLNPSDVAAANHLVPMLRSKFKEEDVQTMLTTISRSTARMMGT